MSRLDWLRSFDAILLDVGNVLFYDFPYEAAFSHLLYAELRRARRDFRSGPGDLILAAQDRSRIPVEIGPTQWDKAVRVAWDGVLQHWELLAAPIPGALKALDSLGGVRIAIVANQPPAMLGVLQKFGVDRRLQSIVLDSLVGVSKPDPAIYELALAQLGVRPEHTLMVGDRLDNDIIPAARVGLTTAWIRAFPISHTLPVALATTEWVRRYLADPRLRQRQDRFQAKPDVTAERLLDLVEG